MGRGVDDFHHFLIGLRNVPQAPHCRVLHSLSAHIRSPRWGDGKGASYAFLASFLYSSIARIEQIIKQIMPDANQK